ncbi:MAG: class I SAM-dependent methyltransferase [Thermoanaerobaculia bacterium]
MKFPRVIRHELPVPLDAVPPFRPTYEIPGEFVNDQHRFYSTCPANEHLVDLGIDGWLRREDALKLYELAYFAPGPILEMGSYHGLSTSILARAVADSGPDRSGRRIISVELDPAAQAVARGHLERLGLTGNVTFVQSDAHAYCLEAIAAGERFAFAFIDHDHAYASVLPVCRELPNLMLPEGFCLFHDWLDARNFQPDEADYGVFGATRDGLAPQQFSFYGVFGVTGLYRREPSVAGGPIELVLPSRAEE